LRIRNWVANGAAPQWWPDLVGAWPSSESGQTLACVGIHCRFEIKARSIRAEALTVASRTYQDGEKDGLSLVGVPPGARFGSRRG
jgi:hypothetical protein